MTKEEEHRTSGSALGGLRPHPGHPGVSLAILAGKLVAPAAKGLFSAMYKCKACDHKWRKW